MGIGLFIAKEIIARHRGKIWVESAGAGKGSTFSFTLSTASSDRGRNK
jgi:signal transduction histidine kinase